MKNFNSERRRATALALVKENKAKDPDYYRKIGAKGGANGHTGGVFNNPERARFIGKLGGRKLGAKVGPYKKRKALN